MVVGNPRLIPFVITVSSLTSSLDFGRCSSSLRQVICSSRPDCGFRLIMLVFSVALIVFGHLDP